MLLKIEKSVRFASVKIRVLFLVVARYEEDALRLLHRSSTFPKTNAAYGQFRHFCRVRAGRGDKKLNFLDVTAVIRQGKKGTLINADVFGGGGIAGRSRDNDNLDKSSGLFIMEETADFLMT